MVESTRCVHGKMIWWNEVDNKYYHLENRNIKTTEQCTEPGSATVTYPDDIQPSYVFPDPEGMLSLEETIYRGLYRHQEKDALTLAQELTSIVDEWRVRARQQFLSSERR